MPGITVTHIRTRDRAAGTQGRRPGCRAMTSRRRLKDLLGLDPLRGDCSTRASSRSGLRWRVTPALGLPRAAVLGVPATPQCRRSDRRFLHRRADRRLSPRRRKVPRAVRAAVRAAGPRAQHTPDSGGHRERARPSQSSAAAADGAGAGQHAAARPLPASVYRRILLPRRVVHGYQCDGVTMKGWIAREQDWELIEVVGLPGKSGEISGYHFQQQGDPATPEDPPDAACGAPRSVSTSTRTCRRRCRPA